MQLTIHIHDSWVAAVPHGLHGQFGQAGVVVGARSNR